MTSQRAETNQSDQDSTWRLGDELFELQRVGQQFYRWHLDDWIDPIRNAAEQAIRHRQTGDWDALIHAVARLPIDAANVAIDNGIVVAGSPDRLDEDHTNLAREVLKQIGPWEKGPWRILGIDIDAQWRSDRKWDRISDAIDWPGKVVMDLGCGNGYYAWRMLDAGAAMVMGVDPTATSVCQAAAVGRIVESAKRPMILPLRDSDLPLDLSRGSGRGGVFDVVTSMGVIYHHVSPIEHLRRVAALLSRDGTAMIETLIVPDSMGAMTPDGRYAGMANVWIIPSIKLLTTWLRRVGLHKIDVLDLNWTTVAEQRRTQWSPGDSLAEGLDPTDWQKTIEGHPGCQRVLVRCQRR